MNRFEKTLTVLALICALTLTALYVSESHLETMISRNGCCSITVDYDEQKVTYRHLEKGELETDVMDVGVEYGETYESVINFYQEWCYHHHQNH